MMSATPIPRTLAMTYSRILERLDHRRSASPDARRFSRKLMSDARREEADRPRREAAPTGRQVYRVLSADRDETLQLQTAVEDMTYETLVAALPASEGGAGARRLSAEPKKPR